MLKQKSFFLLSIFLSLSVMGTGCSTMKTSVNPERITAQSEEFTSQYRSRMFEVDEGAYLGATAVPMTDENSHTPSILWDPVSLRMNASPTDICLALSAMIGKRVTVEGIAASKTPSSGEKTEQATGGTVDVNYSGSLVGLLDELAVKFDLSWSYLEKEETFAFTKFQVRTFTILAAPGTMTYSNQITNQSSSDSESESGGGGSEGGNIDVTSTGDNTTETAQTNTAEANFKTWDEVSAGIRVLLSSEGRMNVEESAGTITVHDTAKVMKRVEQYVNNINEKLGKQVVLSVKVWTLEMSDNADISMNLQTIFENGDVFLQTGENALPAIASGGNLTATILDGKLKNSGAFLKALKSMGKASQVTSGGGVVMNNTPVPIQATTKEAYLAGVNTFQGDYGQTTEVTAGEVTTGFAMTVIPHVLEQRRVILQYNISLSSLDAMNDFSSDDVKVQLPKISSRSFSQRVKLKLGQTLILAGFESERNEDNDTVALLGTGTSKALSKSVIIVTIQVENGDI